MRRFEIHLCQDKGFYDVFAKERPDEVVERCFNTNKEAIYYTMDKLLEAPKKYEYAVLFDNEGKRLIYVRR